MLETFVCTEVSLSIASESNKAGRAFLGMVVVLCTSHVPLWRGLGEDRTTAHLLNSEQALWRVYSDVIGRVGGGFTLNYL